MAVNFAAVLVELRRQAGLTQEQTAERCGLSVRTLRNLETGRHVPRRSTVELIVDGLEPDENDAAQLRAAHAGDRHPISGTPGLLIPHQLPPDPRHFAGPTSASRRSPNDWSVIH